MTMQWQGVMPAMTTAFHEDLTLDHEFIAQHASWMIDHGCTGIVTPGSLGEGNTLTFEERGELWATLVRAVGARVPVVAAISALSTAEAIAQAKLAEAQGCAGLMVLPPYVYQGDWREMKYHVAEVFKATPLSCMLYNNPVAYGTDFLPEHIAELAAEFSNFHAVKESSTDTRRVTAIRALIADRLAILVGVDDGIVEALHVGAVGWIAGLVNAFPQESVDVFNLTVKGEHEKAMRLYNWFLPLLRLDTVPKFVQLIKLAQAAVNMGSARVRPPRLELIGAELAEAQAVIQHALQHRLTSA